MIFATGVVLMIVGFLVVNLFGGPTVLGIKLTNKADYYGAGTFLAGFVASLGSVVHFVAKVLA